METIPARIIVQVFTNRELSELELTELSAQMAERLAEHLQAEGYRPPFGGKWFVNTVAQLLKRTDAVRVHTTQDDNARTH